MEQLALDHQSSQFQKTYSTETVVKQQFQNSIRRAKSDSRFTKMRTI